MATKGKSDVEGTTNSNVNTNTNNININIEPPRKRAKTTGSKSKKGLASDNWLLKAVVGGVIAIAVAMAIYVLQGRSGNNKTPENLPRMNQIEGAKQN